MKTLDDYDQYQLDQLEKARDQVRWLLEHHERARNNDFYLQWLWLRKVAKIPNLPFLDWSKIQDYSGRLETIRRTRQKIQNEFGEFLPTDPEVLEARARKSASLRRIINLLEEEEG